MKFRYILILILFSSIVFTQDVYPFFSDPIQQLEFEQKRIYINEVKKERQYISGGGDVFNWWSLLSDYEPTYKTAPISTSYTYKYTFEIVQNGKKLNEVEFIQDIGLTDLANKIKNSHKTKLNKYRNDMISWDNNRYYTKEIWNPYLLSLGMGSIAGGIITLSISAEGNNRLLFGNEDWKVTPKTLKTIGVTEIIGGTILGILSMKFTKDVKRTNYNIEKPVEPVLKQHLTNNQIKSIAESHNRKVYKEILEKR